MTPNDACYVPKKNSQNLLTKILQLVIIPHSDTNRWIDGFMNLKIKKVFCFTLILFMGMGPFMAGAAVEMCSGNMDCPFCASHDMGPDISIPPFNSNNSCCAGTEKEACDFEHSPPIDISENLISVVRTVDYGSAFLMLSTLDSIIQPPVFARIASRLKDRAVPFPVPIFLQNLSFIC